MVRPIKGYEGPQAGVSVPGFSSDSATAGAGFSRLGESFFRLAQQEQRREDKRAAALAGQAGVDAANAGGYQLQDEGTVMGAAFNEMARDTFAKQLESKSRAKIIELGQKHVADPVALQSALDEYQAGVVEEVEGFDPAMASGFKSVWSVLSADAIGDARNNALKVATDANRAAVNDALIQRGASISQLSKKFGGGDTEAGLAAQVERDLMLADLLKAGPRAEFEFGGQTYPAGSGALTVQEIQEKMAILDAEMDEQGILGWWEGGPAAAKRADEWYKSDVAGMTQDRKDKIYGFMLADVKEADYRANQAQAAADRAKQLEANKVASDLSIALARGEASYPEIEKAYADGTITPSQRAQMTIALDADAAQAKAAADKLAAEEEIRIAGKQIDHEVSELQIKIARGQATAADVEQMYNDQRIDGPARTQLLLSIMKQEAAAAETQAALQLVSDAKSGNVRLDPKNSSHRDAITADYRQSAAAFVADGTKTDADLQGWTIDYAVRVGMVPDDVKAQWRGLLVSGTDEQRIQAADAIEQLRTANPALVEASFEKADIELATMLADQVRAGVPQETAVKNVLDSMRLDKATVDARNTAFDQAYKPTPGQSKIQVAAGELKASINSATEQWVGWLPGVADNPGVPDVMAAEYLSLVQDSYARTGDLTTARKVAADSLRNVWGVSGMNGGRSWMRYAPETYYAAPPGWNLSGAENTAWMKDQLLSEVTAGALIDPDNRMTAERISIMPDALNRRDDQNRPLYTVLIQQPGGALAPVLDAAGRPMLWQPDWAQSAKFKELELKQAQEFFDSRLTRAGKPVTASQSAPGGAVTAKRVAPTLERADDGSIGYFTGKEKDGPAYVAGESTPKGLVEPGNLDLNSRKVLKNDDGSISTESSMSFEENGKEVLIPTVVNGNRLSEEAAVQHYRKTGEHLGKFETPADADAYANKLHDEQDAVYNNGKKRKSKKAREFVPVDNTGKEGTARYLNPGGE